MQSLSESKLAALHKLTSWNSYRIARGSELLKQSWKRIEFRNSLRSDGAQGWAGWAWGLTEVNTPGQSPETEYVSRVNDLTTFPRPFNGQKMVFLTNGVGKPVSAGKRMKLGPPLRPHTKINSKWIKGHIRNKTIKLLGKKQGWVFMISDLAVVSLYDTKNVSNQRKNGPIGPRQS